MKKNSELISVIIPVYKVKKYLDKCVNSVINQTYKELEIILVDDGSPDECGKMCDEYALKDERIVVIHKENGGLSDARNVGIEKATGEYITFVDSDDFVDSDYVEFLYKMIKEANCKMSICSHKVLYESGKVIDLGINKKSLLSNKEVLEKILYSDGIDLSAWAKLYAKSLFKNVKFPKGRLFEDAATTYKLILQCDDIMCGQISKYNYYIRNDSITTSTFSEKKLDLIISTKEMCDCVDKKYPELQSATLRRKVYAHLSTLTQLIKDKENNYKIERKKIIKYVRKNSSKVFFNSRTPMRDKIAIITVFFGFGFYKFCWGIYDKLTNRN